MGNLSTGEVHFMKESVKDTTLKIDVIVRTVMDFDQLVNYQKRLIFLSKHANTSLLEFKHFFLHGASSKESLTLKNLQKTIENFMNIIAGDISKSCDSWKKYGALNTQTQDFEFFPTLLIEPLKYQLEFQEALIQTQLFVSYVDEKKDVTTCLKNLRNGGNIASFIATWLYYRWKLYLSKTR